MIKEMEPLLNKNSLEAKAHAAFLSKELEGTVFAENANILALQSNILISQCPKTFQSLETEIRNHVS